MSGSANKLAEVLEMLRNAAASGNHQRILKAVKASEDAMSAYRQERAARCGSCNDVIKPDALTGTTCQCAQQALDLAHQYQAHAFRMRLVLNNAREWVDAWPDPYPDGDPRKRKMLGKIDEVVDAYLKRKLLPESASLMAAAERVVSAFRALGEARDIGAQISRHRECEASMVALAGVVAAAKGGA